MKLVLEIRPGEGGDDAKLLVGQQSALYLRYAEKHGLAADIEKQGHL
jgi:protein subunit release factor A